MNFTHTGKWKIKAFSALQPPVKEGGVIMGQKLAAKRTSKIVIFKKERHFM